MHKYNYNKCVDFANKQLKAIWKEAISLGYYDYFINKQGPSFINNS